MFVYVSKNPYAYVYGDHEGVHKKAKVPYGVKLETIGDKPYDLAWKLRTVPPEYWGAYSHEGYPDWWIAAADVSLTPVVPEPEPPEPIPPAPTGDMATAIATLRSYGIKSITLE